MGLLSRKSKIGIEEFCRQFYDSQIFHPIIAGEDVGSGFWETAFNFVAEADQSFAAIDPAVFQREMIALRIELFGLAWMHHLKQDKYILPEIVFTKSYLEQNGQLDIWDAMCAYNQAIARSSVEVIAGERMRRAWIVGMNKFKIDSFGEWVEAGVEPECATHLGNRLGTDVAWSKGITLKMLTARLADRLGCDINLNSEALFRLGSVIFGLYNGAKEAIKSVNLQS